jgi:hypothetical protein
MHTKQPAATDTDLGMLVATHNEKESVAAAAENM